MNERILLIRKTLNLTQDKFGEELGLARNTIANYECGRRVPTNSVVTSICREFNVDENWLRTGEGEMFVKKTEEEEIADLVYDLLDPKDDDFLKAVLNLLQTYKDLTPASKTVIKEFAVSFAEKCQKRKGD